MDHIEIAKLLYDFKKHHSAIWTDGNDLQLLVSDKFKTPELKVKLTDSKSGILEFLRRNSIYSKEDFLQRTIFSVDCDKTGLSFAQQRLWFIEQFEEGTFAYHVPAVYELNKETDPDGIKYALREIVKRHEVLRTTIVREEDGEEIIQKINSVPLAFEKVTVLETSDYNDLIREDLNRPFDLSKEYPIRAKFYTVISKSGETSKMLLSVTMHHIASDGWSVDLFENEFYKLYNNYVHSSGEMLSELSVQYKDYSIWQNHYLSEDILSSQLSYWKEKLSGCQQLDLPMDFSRLHKVNYEGEYFYFSISAEISNKLRSLANRLGVTLHSVMLSGFSILLGKYSNQNDIVTGSPVANRQLKQTEALIGFFVNTQVNRIRLNTSQTFEDLILTVYQDQTEQQFHQDIPFEKLVEELQIERDPTKHPIFQILIGVQSFGSQSQISGTQKSYLKRLKAEEFYKVERFDMTILIDDSREELLFQLSYSKSLFQKETIQRFTDHLKQLLFLLTGSPEQPYSELSLVPDNEFQKWNATEKEYPDKKTFQHLFQLQVKKTPDNIAVSCAGLSLTYKELNEKSNQLANLIRSQYEERWNKKPERDTIIALYLERSIEMAVSILAVLKAGAAYVPLDTAYPKERIDYILQDTDAKFILTKSDAELAGLSKDRLIFADLDSELIKKYSGLDPEEFSGPDDLAYVIYTSGSTGKPKGAMIEHKGMLNHLYAKIDLLSLNANSNVVQNASQCFDISVWQFLAALLCGGKVSIYNEELILNPAKLITRVNEDAVTVLEVVPSYLSAMLDVHEEETQSGFSSLEHLLVTGEELKADLVKRWFNHFPAIQLINAYGPTEASDDITHHIITQYSGEKLIPVGKPVQNMKIYIVNDLMQQQPIGVVGEICVSGVGVGRGYLNNEIKTKEVFTIDPFRLPEKIRLYKTGDLGKWLPDGTIQYLGRKDDQVKIRGYRIELGEIEQTIAKINGIRQACVVVKEKQHNGTSNKYLIAYYTAIKSDKAITNEVLSKKLREELPEYMVPDTFMEIESFPLSSNGKLDKKALPDFNLDLPDGTEYMEPLSDLEKNICNIWGELLGVEKVGLKDDFFKIGGNSILAIQVSHRMSKRLGAEVKVAHIFKWKNVKALIENTEIVKATEDQVEWEV